MLVKPSLTSFPKIVNILNCLHAIQQWMVGFLKQLSYDVMQNNLNVNTHHFNRRFGFCFMAVVVIVTIVCNVSNNFAPIFWIKNLSTCFVKSKNCFQE